MKIYGLAFTLMMFLLFTVPATASEWCVNSTTRAFSDAYTLDNNGSISTYVESNLNEYCNYGCAGGRCIQGSEGDSITLVILFMLISFGFLYLGLNIGSEKLAPLSYIFIPLGITFMIVSIFFLGNQSVFGDGMNEALAGMMWALIVILMVVIAVFFILIITGMLGELPYGKKKYAGKT